MVKVMVGAPVRDRAWVLPRFIGHLQRVDLTGITLESLFLVNDCADQSAELLQAAGLTVVQCNNLPTKTDGSIRGQYSYTHLAALRNLLVTHFLETDNEYLLSVDTDVLLPPHGLRRLIDHGRDICSMLLCNQQGRKGRRAHNIMRRDPTTGVLTHILRWSFGGMVRVDLTGAVYLIHRRVLEKGVRYGGHPVGEDFPFCQAAQAAGFTLWCDTSLTPVHIMAPGIELVGGC